MPRSPSVPPWRHAPVRAAARAPWARGQRECLKRLVGLRFVALLGQLLVLGAADRLLVNPLPVLEIASVLGAHLLFNAWTLYRLSRPREFGDRELLWQLCSDMLALIAVLALTGGAANPFNGMALLPLALGAAWLTWAHAWLLALAGVAGYSVLLAVSAPLELAGGPAQQMALLSAGLWVSYTLTAVVIVTVIARIAWAYRREEQAVEAARLKCANDEHIVRIGALAAGAAHELSSPLASIGMVVDELRGATHRPEDVEGGLDTIARVLEGCRDTLATLLSYGNRTVGACAERVAIDDFMRACVECFALRRPEAVVRLHADTPGPAPRVLANRGLRQAITTVLDNAADVSPRAIEVTLSWDSDWLRIGVRDHGPGVPPEIQERAGRLAFYTTKEHGRGNGLGLYLATAVVGRFGGTLTLGNAEGGGALASIVLPVSDPGEPA